ncbi:hypothetical protein A2230_05815 [candidate division WOR-1 bacterium RIFOXYA2_FULL_36_21]|uniref:Uncharacterized protein n=1 Tax=candidate division WOR-1 bacterium RIFOXYB2_FULL_36_35 TaxID=1802578 RepID=A0A1F4S8Z1_UNCSA|nr:MAG: hypothetical protein A2230_05815 [candidate division WOR-1 bacterium RIFOXYA2_FULL_36_21]OGC16872.1 MAG: hypothetical protein A2290_05100 [candidate division WOR-1 bacterium RIFOXYB2_FULL_36_35]OGC18661.1 MAG: hypothetical protein A2282_07110 [candidate division WOR-1 bacterium RIFOXYA12_FULL_36_13]
MPICIFFTIASPRPEPSSFCCIKWLEDIGEDLVRGKSRVVRVSEGEGLVLEKEKSCFFQSALIV